MYIYYVYLFFIPAGEGPITISLPGVKTALGGLSFCDDALIGGGNEKSAKIACRHLWTVPSRGRP